MYIYTYIHTYISMSNLLPGEPGRPQGRPGRHERAGDPGRDPPGHRRCIICLDCILDFDLVGLLISGVREVNVDFQLTYISYFKHAF